MLIENIKNLKCENAEIWQNNTRSGISTAVFGVSKPARYFLASKVEGKVLYIAPDFVSAKDATREIYALTNKKVVYLPAKDDVLLFKKFFNKENLYNRITALYEIMDGAEIVVTTLEALIQLLPKKLDYLKIYSCREYLLDEVITTLIDMGYKREEFANEKGEFAVRGDILEVFPVNEETAFRCDFFGDEVEKIRTIDQEKRTLLDEVRSFTVLPTVDWKIEKEEVDGILVKIQKSLKNFKTLNCSVKAKQIANALKDLLERENYSNPSLSFLMPLLKGSQGEIQDYFDFDTVLFEEPKLILDYANGTIKEHQERYKSLLSAGEVFDFSVDNLTSVEKVVKTLTKKPCHSFQNLNSIVPFFSPLQTLRLSIIQTPKYSSKPTDLETDLINWKKLGYKSIIACGSQERAQKLNDSLMRAGIMNIVSDSTFDDANVYLTSYYLTNGFIFHDEKVVVIGTCDLFLSGVKDKKIKKKRNDTFTAPEVGDFAVHEVHGVGIVRGTKRISTSEFTKDYVAVEYFGGDFLYVPVDQMDKLTKYLGGDKAPQLNKIGGVEFDRIKQRVRASISQMTINLKKLYKDRAEQKGFSFSPDNELTLEFEDAFEYDLTEDQEQSIIEIKKDMESPKIMDRLLLGDVGFGKTEVAIRACFKAVMDLKQVAIVAPTTILTEQHYQTFSERFKGFGVRIGLLNRFQKPSQIKRTLERLKNGEIDIVIGTHRLFGKDVVFKDLGLLVLDEEQCFGVEHKEKLRTLKNNVDTITMSATPIPRTLHMSLSGIRDISLILTPPHTRIPVQAYLVEESETLIRDAVLKEISRGGQVFILYNHVDSIYRFSERIATLLPEAKIVVGHGQMTREGLENHIMAFYNGEYNVLIATTIIENGIDVPNANTLIVIDADKLGLFTLYQLKGRVGRSDRMAHAYFTYKQEKVLSDTAYKRLSAIMENSELGSGYKIAMKDLEIRGAGNVLGKEQHGHMDRIGYELYAKLLREQLGEVTKEFETELDIKFDAFIPNDYVSVQSSRLDLYKAIAEIKDESDGKRVTQSILENYGKIPYQVENLVLLAELKYLCKKNQVIALKIREEGAILTLIDLNSFANGGLTSALNEYKSDAVLSFGVNPTITISKKIGVNGLVKLVKEFLEFSLKSQK